MDLLRVSETLYSAFLLLYPAEFQAEFGAEMRTVFLESLPGARKKGFLAVLSLFVREAADYPISLFGEHWEETIMQEFQLQQPIRRPVWWGAVGFGLTAVLARILSDILIGGFFPFFDSLASRWFPWGAFLLYAAFGWLGGSLFGIASQQVRKIRLFEFAGLAGFLIGHFLGDFGMIGLSILSFYAEADYTLIMIFARSLDLICFLGLTGMAIGLLQKDYRQAVRLALRGSRGTAAGGLATVLLFLLLSRFLQSTSAKVFLITGLIFSPM